MRDGGRERAEAQVPAPRLRGERELGQERHARPAGDHLHEGGEAGRPELQLVRAGTRAHLERLRPQAVPVVQEENVRSAQLGRARGAAARAERMIARGREDERIAGDLGVLDLAELGLEREQRRVEGAGVEPPDELLRLVLHPRDREARIGGAERGRGAGQQVGRHRRDDAHPQRAGEGVARRARGGGEVVRLDEHAPRTREERLARRGDQHAPPVALEEPHAQGRLELRDLGGERGLRDAAPLGGAAEAQGLRDGERVLQLAEREGVRRERRHRLILTNSYSRCIGKITAPAAPSRLRRGDVRRPSKGDRSNADRG